MNKPFFSVIIPTYNRANLLGYTIESVLAQTFNNFELLVIDDGSTDDTRDLVNSFFDSTNIRYIYQENQGQGIARNTGIEKARGEWVAFLDSDDLWLPNHLQSHYDLIASGEGDISWIHSGYLFFDDRGKKFPGYGRPLSGDVFPELVKTGNFISMGTVKIKKCVIKNYLFNENYNLPCSEDWELWIRISADYQLHYLPEVTCLIRMHSGRSMHNLENVNVGAWAAADSLLKNNAIAPRLNLYKKQMLGYICFYLATNYYGAGLMSEARFHLQKAILYDPKLLVSLRFSLLVVKIVLGKRIVSKLKKIIGHNFSYKSPIVVV